MFLNALLSFHQLHHTGLSGEESCFSDLSPPSVFQFPPLPSVSSMLAWSGANTYDYTWYHSISFAAHLLPSVFILCCCFWEELLNNKQLHLVRIEVSWWNEWPLSNSLKCRLEYFWDLNTDIQTFTQDTHVDSHGILIDLSWLYQSYHVNRVVTIWQTQYDSYIVIVIERLGPETIIRKDFQNSMSVLELELNQISTIPAFPPITQPCLQGKVVTM